MPLGSILRGRTRRDRPVPAAEPDHAPDRDLLDRFARHGDQQAFAALVRRHGPPVLGVCRRVLRDPHAAEDAFQATFLVLARKAHAIAQPEALGSWLYGVAIRVACKARAGAPGRPPAHCRTRSPTSRTRRPASPGGAAADPRRGTVPDAGPGPHPDRPGLPGGADARRGGPGDRLPAGVDGVAAGRAREDLRRRLARRGVGLAVGALLLLASVGRGAGGVRVVVGRVAGAARKGPAGAAPRWSAGGCRWGVCCRWGCCRGGPDRRRMAAAHGHKPPSRRPRAHGRTPPTPWPRTSAAAGHDVLRARGGCGGSGSAPVTASASFSRRESPAGYHPRGRPGPAPAPFRCGFVLYFCRHCSRRLLQRRVHQLLAAALRTAALTTS